MTFFKQGRLPVPKRSILKFIASGTAAAALTLGSLGAHAASDTVRLGYVEWDSCTVATNVTKGVLEDAGYDVKTISVSAALMYEGLANGDLDAIMCAWLPTSQADYYAKTRDRLENLGPNMDGAPLGLAVPDYVEARSIPDLVEHADDFGGRIIGIDPGAGIMRLTHNVIDHYELPMKLVEGSDATMVAVLDDAIRREQPVVVTAWEPHWMWVSYNLRFLDDPDNVFGDPNEIDTLVRKGLKEDEPRAYAILDAIKLDGEARGTLMVADRENDNQEANARQWIEDNQDLVSEWLAAAQ